MPNFFKKLTNSFKMNEEEDALENDLFSDEESGEESRGDPEKKDMNEMDVDNDEDANLDGTSSPEQEEDITPEMEESDPMEEPTETEEEMGMDDESGEEETKNAMEEERPYTIAQLAKAQTKKREAKPKRSTQILEENETNVSEGQLAIDVYETPTEIVIKSTIAGARPEDLDIGVENNTVNIRGSRHTEDKVKGEDYLYQECYWGTFSRSVILPVEVDSDKAQASLRDGVLTIKIPKIQKEKEKKIKILS